MSNRFQWIRDTWGFLKKLALLVLVFGITATFVYSQFYDKTEKTKEELAILKLRGQILRTKAEIDRSRKLDEDPAYAGLLQDRHKKRLEVEIEELKKLHLQAKADLLTARQTIDLIETLKKLEEEEKKLKVEPKNPSESDGSTEEKEDNAENEPNMPAETASGDRGGSPL